MNLAGGKAGVPPRPGCQPEPTLVLSAAMCSHVRECVRSDTCWLGLSSRLLLLLVLPHYGHLLLPLRLLTLQLEMCTRLCYTSTVAVQKMILIINRESNFLGGLYDPSSSGLSFVEKQRTSE